MIFLPIGLLCEANYDFFKDESSPKKWQHFGLLSALSNLLHFHVNKQFQNKVFVGILRFPKWFDVVILGFQIELFCLYGLEIVWATF